MNRMLSTIPSGRAREQMKTLLESSATADLEKTFKKYAHSILTEAKVRPNTNNRNLTEASLSLRNGNSRNAVPEEDEDEDIVNLRRLSGIK
jgi:hypothetical protein